MRAALSFSLRVGLKRIEFVGCPRWREGEGGEKRKIGAGVWGVVWNQIGLRLALK